MANKTLDQLRVRKEGLTILGIERKNTPYLGSPGGKAIILPADILTVYGKSKVIQSIFTRKKDFQGTLEHQELVKEENERLKEDQ